MAYWKECRKYHLNISNCSIIMLIIIIILLCVYVAAYFFRYVHVVHVEATGELWLFSMFSWRDFLEIESLSEPGVHWICDKQVHKIFLSPFTWHWTHSYRVADKCDKPDFLHVCWRYKLSACAHWALSQPLVWLFFMAVPLST